MIRARLIVSLLIGAAMSVACSSKSNDASSSAQSSSAPSGDVGCTADSGDSYAPGLQKQGAAGRYSFTLVSSTPAPPALNDNTFVMQITDADGNPVSGALSVALDMPEHGHSSPTVPDIEFDAKTNAFTLDPMNLFMVGLWRLTFSFQADSGSAADADSAVFNFCID